MKKIEGQRRQGDILFERDDLPWQKRSPEDAEIQEDGVVARGEVTGHMHRISDAKRAVLMVSAAMVYIKSMSDDADVIHDEHNPIILPIGNWNIVRQQQYTPKGWVRVVD
jgi:hypothetical protein